MSLKTDILCLDMLLLSVFLVCLILLTSIYLDGMNYGERRTAYSQTQTSGDIL